MKESESKNLLHMSHRMQALSSTIRANTKNSSMLEQINRITPLLQQQGESMSVEQLYK
jgi:hypothetical protein